MESTAEDLQEAFQAFMLGSGSKTNTSNNNSSSGKKKKKKGNPNSTPSPQVRTPSTKATSSSHKEHQRSVQKQKTKKQYYQILNHFQKVLQDDWIQVDDHLGEVVASIANLRNRIHKTSQQLWRWENNPPPPSTGGAFRPCQEPSTILGHLLPADLELALSHGLIQHEKMLVGTRKLMSSLNQAQEALGRRLDELMLFHLDWGPLLAQMEDGSEEDTLEDFAAAVLWWCESVFRLLADELYRKQCLIQTLVDSVNDGLLYTEGDEDLLSEDVTPRKAANQCLKSWTRGGLDQKNRDYLEHLLKSTPWDEDKTVVER